MLNYIWLALILIGVGAALYYDVSDIAADKYKNGKGITVQIGTADFSSRRNVSEVIMNISSEEFFRFYKTELKTVNQKIKLTNKNNSYSVFIPVNEESPAIWQDMAPGSSKNRGLTAELRNIRWKDSLNFTASAVPEYVSFVKMKEVTSSALDYASTAVNISLGLIGIMALWLGVMKIAFESGLINKIANVIKPVTSFLFPEVPSDHPAIGAMIMNISANMLGLGNAATPFGLKAMEELDNLNPEKGKATNAMCTFLAINTAGLTLIPATAIAIRAAAGSSDPAVIIGTAFFGALCATITGIIAAKVLERFSYEKGKGISFNSSNIMNLFYLLLIPIAAAVAGIILFASGVLSFNKETVSFIKSFVSVVSILAIPSIISAFLLYGLSRKVKIYEVFVTGAKEGFEVAVRIIPYLVAMLVAIGIFRAGGGMELFQYITGPIATLIGMPVEAVPMAIMRPLSGSGSMGIMTEIIAKYGADSTIGIMVSTIFGSTETTFYVIAVYFGSVSIKKIRHSLLAGLIADAAGILAAVFIVNLLFG